MSDHLPSSPSVPGSPLLASVIVRSMDPPTLQRALDSVAAQNYAPVEVVLVAACGASHRPVDASRYPFRLTFVASDVRLPRPRAANAGLAASRGELITFLDHDDEFLSGHLSGLAAALAADPGAGAAYCRFEVYEAGKLFVTVGHAFDRLALHEKSYIHHSAFLFRRALLDTGARYDEALDIHDDWDFVLQLSEVARFAFVDQTTFRWHSDIGTSGGGGVGNFDGEKYARQRDYVRDKWAGAFAAHVERYNANVELGMAALREGALGEAERRLDAALADVANDADLLNARAMLAYQRRDHAAACDFLARALAERGADARLWFNGGLANAAAGRVAAARAAFGRVLALQPGHPGATQWLARLSA
jgi:glycosyltransferase involved in cell wall biosynthesis